MDRQNQYLNRFSLHVSNIILSFLFLFLFISIAHNNPIKCVHKFIRFLLQIIGLMPLMPKGKSRQFCQIKKKKVQFRCDQCCWIENHLTGDILNYNGQLLCGAPIEKFSTPTAVASARFAFRNFCSKIVLMLWFSLKFLLENNNQPDDVFSGSVWM